MLQFTTGGPITVAGVPVVPNTPITGRLPGRKLQAVSPALVLSTQCSLPSIPKRQRRQSAPSTSVWSMILPRPLLACFQGGKERKIVTTNLGCTEDIKYQICVSVFTSVQHEIEKEHIYCVGYQCDHDTNPAWRNHQYQGTRLCRNQWCEHCWRLHSAWWHFRERSDQCQHHNWHCESHTTNASKAEPPGMLQTIAQTLILYYSMQQAHPLLSSMIQIL